jgi:HPt (histidine-containing phosphotransfer) domain-containing protein
MSQEAFPTSPDELRRAYATELPERIAALAAACETLLAAPENRAARASAVFLAHKLAGGCGIFGLPGPGRIAKSLELLLLALSEEAMKPSAAPPPAQQIRPLVASLREACKNV